MLHIQRLAHAAIVIKTEHENLYFDPFMLKSITNDADYLFISHEHYDHFSPLDIEKVIKSNTVLIAPKSVINLAINKGLAFKDMIEVEQSGSYKVSNISFKTVPAYNVNKPYHLRKSGGVGYILFLGDETVYFAGDTDITDELMQVKCTIAILPIGGKYTMDAPEAAKAANKIMPREAIPIHYSDLDSTAGADAAVYFEALLLSDIKCRII